MSDIMTIEQAQKRIEELGAIVYFLQVLLKPEDFRHTDYVTPDMPKEIEPAMQAMFDKYSVELGTLRANIEFAIANAPVVSPWRRGDSNE